MSDQPESPSPPTAYLGDGIYALLSQRGDLRLTTGSHLQGEATNLIWLNRDVYKALVKFADENNFLGDR